MVPSVGLRVQRYDLFPVSANFPQKKFYKAKKSAEKGAESVGNLGHRVKADRKF